MKRLLYVLAVFTLSLLSCREKSGVYYFFDEVSKDTIMSILLFSEPNAIEPTAKIVFKDSIYERETVKDLLTTTEFESLIETGKDYCSSNLLFYVYNGSFSDYSLYNDSLFYIKSHISFLGEDSYLGAYVSPLLENDIFTRKRLEEKHRKQAVLDSIAKNVKDSVTNILGQKEMKMSFMGIEIGKPYSNSKSKYRSFINQNGENLFKDVEYTIEPFHSKDIIYKIIVTLRGSNSEIIKLYREKYGLGYEGKKYSFMKVPSYPFTSKTVKINGELWKFKNGEIKIEEHYQPEEKDRISLVAHTIITYVDYKLDSIAKIEINSDSINTIKKEKERKEKELKKTKEII